MCCEPVQGYRRGRPLLRCGGLQPHRAYARYRRHPSLAPQEEDTLRDGHRRGGADGPRYLYRAGSASLERHRSAGTLADGRPRYIRASGVRLMSYDQTLARVETYFDRTATRAWEALTSDAPVRKIGPPVPEWRDAMRAQMLARLPDDLRGARR